jgi:hypothetical protein
MLFREREAGLFSGFSPQEMNDKEYFYLAGPILPPLVSVFVLY